MLKPLHDYVILKKEKAENKTASGIILTNPKEDASNQAKVVAVGPNCQDFIKEGNLTVYHAKATATAVNEIHLKIVANIVMVGAITKATGIVSEEAARNSILDSVPKGTENKNINAFEAGLKIVEEA